MSGAVVGTVTGGVDLVVRMLHVIHYIHHIRIPSGPGKYILYGVYSYMVYDLHGIF